MAGQVTAPRN